MNILIKSSNGITQVSADSKLMSQRKVFIEGEINAEIAWYFCEKQKNVLITVAALAAAYILISALVIFNVEPESFGSFFDAIYWATVSLTTVGYGDIYPVTTIGRIVTMLSSIFGIAVIALPSGVITAGYLSEIEKNESKWERRG